MAVYQDVAKVLEAEIRGGLARGQYLPSEAELAQRFAINRHTVRRAIDELVLAGLLLRQHGKGTMVVDSRIEYSLRSRARFSETLEELGLRSTCRLLATHRLVADATLAARIGVAAGTPLIGLDTLRCIEDDPVSCISHYLVAALVPGIDEHFAGGSVHACIEKHFGLRIRRKQSLVGATLPGRNEASLLRCSRHLPLIVVRSNNVLEDSGEVIEYSVSRSRSDVFEMKIIPDGRDG